MLTFRLADPLSRPTGEVSEQDKKVKAATEQEVTSQQSV